MEAEHIQILTIQVPDWMSYLAAISTAVLAIWALVAKIQNSGKEEAEVKIADIKHEQAQEQKIQETKADIDRLVNDLKQLRRDLNTLDKRTVAKIGEIDKEIKGLRADLLKLVIGLKNRL